ncbi:TrmB family transcriptional regulator [Salinispirillum marinum]|uniref:TrmB family transcriptional regulator n=2 Tax=Saccharospirillaceae TaxID=255527 RepID=A0ABV8BCR1_9GAMM
MNRVEVLQQLGLEPRETQIYGCLLKLGPASIRDIAQAANLNRGTTYELLKLMQEKGVVTLFPKGRRRFFAAEPPQRLMVLAEERQEKLQTAVGFLGREIIPELTQLRPELGAADVRYYDGYDGIERVLKDILATVGAQKDKSYSVISSRAVRKYLYQPFPSYTKQRIKAGIQVRVIAVGEGGDPAELSERKWLKTDKPTSAYVAIYPPKVALFALQQGDLPSAVVIESPAVADTQQLVFDALWQLL